MERINSRVEMIAHEEVPQPEQCEVQQAAVEFLSQQGVPSLAASSSVGLPAVLAMPVYQKAVPVSELPPAMQIDNSNDWGRHFPLQPAAIVLQ